MQKNNKNRRKIYAEDPGGGRGDNKRAESGAVMKRKEKAER
jgi:hypothetical protein